MLSTFGCGQAVDGSGTSEPSDTAKVLAKIERPDGASMTFLEAEPGVVFVRERGAVGGEPFSPREQSRPKDSVELYERVSGETAPPALVEAVEVSRSSKRTLQRRVAEPEETTAPGSLGDARVGSATQALSNDLSHADFLTKYCPPFVPDTPDYFRWVNVTGRGSLTRSDQLELVSAVMGIAGTVHFVAKYRPWYTWKNLEDEQVPPGWYERVEIVDTWTDFDTRTTVDDADGDTYDMCTHF